MSPSRNNCFVSPLLRSGRRRGFFVLGAVQKPPHARNPRGIQAHPHHATLSLQSYFPSPHGELRIQDTTGGCPGMWGLTDPAFFSSDIQKNAVRDVFMPRSVRVGRMRETTVKNPGRMGAQGGSAPPARTLLAPAALAPVRRSVADGRQRPVNRVFDTGRACASHRRLTG